MNAYKVHTDTIGRLADCIKKAMYGISQKAMEREIPHELRGIVKGDIVFISEREISGNALFGPFYVMPERSGIVEKKRIGAWINIDLENSDSKELAYWVAFEKRKWCLLFDEILSDRISIVWPRDWVKLGLNLPSWGKIPDKFVQPLIQHAVANEVEAREFLQRHELV